MTNDQLFNLYSRYQENHVAPSTYAARMSLLRRWLLPVVGRKEVRVTTTADINKVYDCMEMAGLSTNTLFSAYAAMLSIYRFAMDCGYIQNNPVSSARRYRPTYEQEDHSSWSTPAKENAPTQDTATAATHPRPAVSAATAAIARAKASAPASATRA